MEGQQYQNWIWHTLYFLERRNAPKGKITGMVTREKLIQFIQELEKESWEKATTLEKSVKENLDSISKKYTIKMEEYSMIIYLNIEE